MHYLRPFFIAILLLATLAAQAQKGHKPCVKTIDEAEAAGIDLTNLYNTYQSAINSEDSSKGVFSATGQGDKLASAYREFLYQLGNYLKQHGFKWEQPTRLGQRIYFSPDGSVDYYLFTPKTTMARKQLQQFEKLLTAFAATHKLGVTAPVKFAQCSPVTFTP